MPQDESISEMENVECRLRQFLWDASKHLDATRELMHVCSNHDLFQMASPGDEQRRKAINNIQVLLDIGVREAEAAEGFMQSAEALANSLCVQHCKEGHQ